MHRLVDDGVYRFRHIYKPYGWELTLQNIHTHTYIYIYNCVSLGLQKHSEMKINRINVASTTMLSNGNWCPNKTKQAPRNIKGWKVWCNCHFLGVEFRRHLVLWWRMLGSQVVWPWLKALVPPWRPGCGLQNARCHRPIELQNFTLSIVLVLHKSHCNIDDTILSLW